MRLSKQLHHPLDDDPLTSMQSVQKACTLHEPEREPSHHSEAGKKGSRMHRQSCGVDYKPNQEACCTQSWIIC